MESLVPIGRQCQLSTIAKVYSNYRDKYFIIKMVTMRCMCLVLPFYIMVVQAAPQHARSNILFLDENNNRNVDSLSNIEKQATNLSPKPLLLQNNKSPREIYKSKNKKEVDRFPYLDDMRQNWGILVNVTEDAEEEDEDYKRPINIPKPTETPSRRVYKGATTLSASTPPNLVSGNQNFNVISGTKKTNKPTTCDIALIVCCMKNSNIDTCILANGCFRKVVPTDACQKNELNDILKKMKDYYN